MSNLDKILKVQASLDKAWENEDYKEIYELEQKLEKLQREYYEESSYAKS